MVFARGTGRFPGRYAQGGACAHICAGRSVQHTARCAVLEPFDRMGHGHSVMRSNSVARPGHACSVTVRHFLQTLLMDSVGVAVARIETHIRSHRLISTRGIYAWRRQVDVHAMLRLRAMACDRVLRSAPAVTPRLLQPDRRPSRSTAEASRCHPHSQSRKLTSPRSPTRRCATGAAQRRDSWRSKQRNSCSRPSPSRRFASCP